jgi:ankyrin repeat protein
VLNFLLISHALGEIIPAPLPAALASDTREAGFWAFSSYGKMAHFGTFDETLLPVPKGTLRSHSLLHIAVAKADRAAIARQVSNGINVNALAGDGLAALHWSMANDNTEPMQKLLELGADPDVRSTQGATPIMNAVQSNKTSHLQVLLAAGALINARDNRGFTALHRAAEMGYADIVQILLSGGADKTIEAEHHTALSFAKARGNKAVIELLSTGE